MKHYLGAMAWAAELHGDATPKHWPSPLLAHLVAVSSLAWEDGGDEEQAIGALLLQWRARGRTQLWLRAARRLLGVGVPDRTAAQPALARQPLSPASLTLPPCPWP